MPKYRVEIVASNFLVQMDGKTGKYGFVAVRCLEAGDAHAAELAAVQMLRDDQELRQMVRNAPDDPPVMDVTEIAELEALPDEQPGRIWYEVNPKRWWQFWRR